MQDSQLLVVAGAVVPPLLGLLLWFMNRMITENDRAHSSFSKTLSHIKSDIGDLETRLIKLDVLQPKELKELKDLEKMVLHQKSKMDEIAQKVRRHGEPSAATGEDGERKINYGHFPETPNKIIQALDAPASVNAQNSAFKVEIIGRVGRIETTLQTHEMAIGRVSQLTKDGNARTAQVVTVLKDLQKKVKGG
jgi:ribonuclease D